MAKWNWITALLGSILIGLSATLLQPFNGRIARISCMVNGVTTFKAAEGWRGFLLGGMLIGGAIYEYCSYSA